MFSINDKKALKFLAVFYSLIAILAIIVLLAIKLTEVGCG